MARAAESDPDRIGLTLAESCEGDQRQFDPIEQGLGTQFGGLSSLADCFHDRRCCESQVRQTLDVAARDLLTAGTPADHKGDSRVTSRADVSTPLHVASHLHIEATRRGFLQRERGGREYCVRSVPRRVGARGARPTDLPHFYLARRISSPARRLTSRSTSLLTARRSDRNRAVAGDVAKRIPPAVCRKRRYVRGAPISLQFGRDFISCDFRDRLSVLV